MAFKQVLAVRTDLGMGKGKLAAQCAHAAIAAMQKAHERGRGAWVHAWLAQGQEKIVVRVEGLQALCDLFERANETVPAALVKDAGKTQLPPGTPTCVGLGPAPEEVLDPFTRALKLL